MNFQKNAEDEVFYLIQMYVYILTRNYAMML